MNTNTIYFINRKTKEYRRPNKSHRSIGFPLKSPNRPLIPCYTLTFLINISPRTTIPRCLNNVFNFASDTACLYRMAFAWFVGSRPAQSYTVRPLGPSASLGHDCSLPCRWRPSWSRSPWTTFLLFKIFARRRPSVLFHGANFEYTQKKRTPASYSVKISVIFSTKSFLFTSSLRIVRNATRTQLCSPESVTLVWKARTASDFLM